LLSPTAKLRLLAELILPRSTAHDESVASFFARRLGVAPLEHLIDPFISGTYAGDPASLSIRATFPQLWEAEQRAGSMLRGMLRGRKRGTKRVPRELFNFQRGMASWPQAIADYIGPQRLWCNARVHTLRPTDGSWQIEVERAGQQRQLNAAQIILATPADVTANLIAALDGAAAKALRAISYPPIALVHLAYARVAVKHPVDGFGALCPAREGRKVLGTLWPSALFAGRAPRDTVLTSSFVGGARYPKLALQDDRALIAQVHAEQVALIGVSEAPLFSQIVRWQRSIPQYDAGHLERIAALAAAEQRYSGLYCIGNYRDGVSVERCWQHGVAIAAQMLKRYPVASLQ
jgi:oxygen-dependent protoporphyrinogen oxidase